MERRPGLVLLCIVFAVVCWRWGAPGLIDYDSAQFVLSIDQHDLQVHQPHPPGFVLYVWLIRFLNAFMLDAYDSLRVSSILLSLAAAFYLYRLCNDAYSKRAAGFAVLLFLSAPVVLFHGMTSLIYPAEAFLSIVCGYYAFRALHGTPRDLKLVAFLMALLCGLRQNALLYLAPLLVYVILQRSFSNRDRLLAVGSFIVGITCWLIPQLDATDGWGQYWQSNMLLQHHAWLESPLHSGWKPLLNHLWTGLSFLTWGLGAGRLIGITLCLALTSVPLFINTQRGIPRGFYLAWALPASLTLALYHFPKSGYALVFAPILCLWLGHKLDLLFIALRSLSRKSFGRLAVSLLLLDLVVFFIVPAGSIRRPNWEFPVSANATSSAVEPLNSWILNNKASQGKIAELLFGRVDFFFDRLGAFKYTGAMASLRQLGLPDPQTLMLGHILTRVACFELPEQPIIHADPLRKATYIAYTHRRARYCPETVTVPPEITRLLIEGTADALVIRSSESTSFPASELPAEFMQRLHWIEIGDQDFDALFYPPAISGATAVPLHLVRKKISESLLEPPAP